MSAHAISSISTNIIYFIELSLGLSSNTVLLMVYFLHTFVVRNVSILSVNEKLPVLKFQYFRKYTIQPNGYFCNHVSGQWQTGLEKNASSTSTGTMVHVMHVLFVFFAVFETLIASFL